MHVLRRPTGTCFFTFCGVQKVWKSTRSVPSRQGYRRKAEKGFKFVCAKLLSLCVLIRGLENLEASLKGFNCCGAKMRQRCAESRFAKPRNFLRKERFSYFSRVRKVPKVHQRFANLWTPGTIQIAGRYVIVAKTSDIHQVTGFAKSCNFVGYRRQ